MLASIAAVLFAAQVGALPPGFQKTTVTGGLAEPTSLVFLPDGRPLVGERPGRVQVVNSGGLTTMLALPDVTYDEEWGLLGLALDPAYASNGFIYVFYTPTDLTARVSRFHVHNDVAELASETVIWQNPQPANSPSHHGGCIAFAADGTLFIATGEEMESQWAQDLSSQRGKMLRIRPDGSIPPDNPFVNVQGADPRIWAYGLRNPFRFTIDGEQLIVGDVGYDAWEEADIVRPGDNLGWPLMEGPQCFVSDCSGLVGPVWAYHHDNTKYSTNGEGAIIVGPVYRSTVKGAFPPDYLGNLFVADHVGGWIRRLMLHDDGHVEGEEIFEDGPDAVTIVDMKVGPDGALYYIPIFQGKPGDQPLFRIAYVGGAPVAVATADPSEGLPPLDVHFDGSGSFDPDDPPESLTYAWDFGDGATADAAIVNHSFVSRGVFNASLTVSDGTLSDTAPVEIVVGARPAPVIVDPPDGTQYRAGDTIHFAGYALDAEDGDMPASAFSWTISVVHDTHTHPYAGPLNGIDEGEFTIPVSGHPPEGIYFRIALTATDSDGIPTTVTRSVRPVVSPISLNSEPAGIPLFLDGNPIGTPRTYHSVVNYQHTLSAQPVYTLEQRVYRFDHWSTGSTEFSVFFVAPEGGTSLTAVYTPDCAADFDQDGFVSGIDFDLFVLAFETGEMSSDFDHDGFVTGIDFDLFVFAFEQGC